jgi:hypothetical protein
MSTISNEGNDLVRFYLLANIFRVRYSLPQCLT